MFKAFFARRREMRRQHLKRELLFVHFMEERWILKLADAMRIPIPVDENPDELFEKVREAICAIDPRVVEEVSVYHRKWRKKLETRLARLSP